MSAMKVSQLLKGNIIDHYKSPKNSGALEDFTHSCEVINATCGDEISLWLNVQDGVVTEVGHESRGCAISVAAISMLSEEIMGKSLEELKALRKVQILKMVGLDATSGRVKCALLSCEALQKAILEEE